MHIDRPLSLTTSVQQGISLQTRRYTQAFLLPQVTMHFMHSKKLTNQKEKISLLIQKRFRDGLTYSTPQKAKKQGKMPLPSLSPLHLKMLNLGMAG